ERGRGGTGGGAGGGGCGVGARLSHKHAADSLCGAVVMDRPDLTRDPQAASAASLSLVTTALAADDALQAFAARLGGSVPPAARVSEPLLAPLSAALWTVREGQERRSLAVLVADDDLARELA